MQPSPGEPSRHGEHHPVAHDSGDGVPEEVYAAHRRAVEAAADLGLGRSARRMLAAVLLATVDHDRVECETPVAELAVMAKLDLDDASAALAVLEGRGIVVRSGDDGRRIGLPVNRSVVPASTAGVNGVGGTTNEPVTASEPQRHNRLGRFKRLSWGVGDQALSSVTNFALSILVAHAVERHGFGVFGLAFTT